eukprot:gnl/TRDRNA2_/TRDRNA2_39404_c0_seq1.p1 gnl/TRDRNA2_/TRDRNA2_39404_c0~~gnl/TRDRNA2_/TRDRNA2_39404_c0_seq1.p1  ORF type:complete len:294 (-),score=54.61 gnl/TRDRNA2_/TRDRNA2_39404_c0_seq1:1-882(-)
MDTSDVRYHEVRAVGISKPAFGGCWLKGLALISLGAWLLADLFFSPSNVDAGTSLALATLPTSAASRASGRSTVVRHVTGGRQSFARAAASSAFPWLSIPQRLRRPLMQVSAVKRPGVADDSMVEYSGPKATLSTDTTWRLSLDLEGSEAPVVLKVKFLREEGYEPPQGTIEIVEDTGAVANLEAKNRWELGEDPDGKSENPMDGGGLWIWALFSETPFPYLLFSIELNEYGKVSAKVPHAVGDKRGTVLSDGTATTMKYTDVAADLVGLSRAQISEKMPAGTVRFSPIERYE